MKLVAVNVFAACVACGEPVDPLVTVILQPDGRVRHAKCEGLPEREVRA